MATNATLGFVIQQVYGLKDFQIVGAPKWIADWNTARFEIQATAPGPANEGQLRGMAQALLADRFQLKAHRERRDLAVYGLVAAPGGVQLRVSKEDKKPPGSGGIEFVEQGADQARERLDAQLTSGAI